MRSYNNLYEPMLQDDYIKQRFINASKKKKNRNDVREVLENLDEHTELLKKMLTEELFIPDYHKPSIINESSSKKTRRILKPHYKYEQVIHHCAIGQFKPIVMNGLYEFSCGSIPGRGVHYGKKYMRKWLDSYDGKKFFVLKMDVHHFFESINRRILKRKLKAVIRDKRFYRLLCILIEHDKIALVAKILTDAGVEIDAEQTKTLVGCIAFDDISGALEVLREIGIAGAMFEELKIIIEEMRKGVPLGYFTFTLILAAFIFTVVMIFVFLRMGSEPSTLIENVFRFLSVEGGAMALIKSVKTVKGTKSNGEIQHNDEPEQDDEEVQG